MNDLLEVVRRALRFLVLFVVALAATSTVIAADKLEQAQAIREIERLGGKVKRDDKLPGRPVTEVRFRDGSDFGDDNVSLLKPLTKLTRLDLTHTDVCGTCTPDCGWKELTELKSLRTLILDDTKIGDSGLKQIGELKNLRWLGLRGTRITDASLKELRELKNLTSLDLSSTRIGDAGLTVIREFKSLTSLDVGVTQTTDAGLKELGELKNLAALDLRSTRITGAGLEDIKELKNLASLDVGWTDITNAGLKEIGQLKSLTRLTLVMTPITDAGLKELGELKNLATLDLAQTHITGAGFKDIQQLKNLASLDLRGATEITGAGLGGLKTLTALDLGGTHITDAALKELLELRNLKSLDLGGTQITDAGLKGLKELKNLTALNLSSTQITDAGLKGLRELNNLASLDLGSTQITSAGLKELTQLNNLALLDLSATEITDAGLKDIKELMNLSRLDLSGTKITDAGLKQLQQSLPNVSISPWKDSFDCPGNDVVCLSVGVHYPQTFCFDGSRLLVAHGSVALLWDVNSGKELQRFEGHQEAVQAVLFSPDGTQVLTAGGICQGGEIVVPSLDNSARLWDAATGKEIRRFEGSTACIEAIAFSPSARRILTQDGHAEHTAVRVWDVSTCKQLLKLGQSIDQPSWASFTPDGRSVLAGRNAGRQICVWDIETGAERVRLNSREQWLFQTAAIDPGGKIILTACTELHGGEFIGTPGTDFKVRTWNANTGQLEHVFQGHTDFIRVAAFSSDGKAFITASSDGTVRLWPTAMSGKIRVFRHGKGPVNRVFLSPDRKKIFAEWSDERFVLVSDHGSLWDVDTGKELRRFGGEANGMAGFSPDSNKFVIADTEGCAAVLSAETGAIIRKFPKFARH
jgi:internalin A